MTTLKEAVAAYRIIAGADGKSEHTIQWVCDSAKYLSAFIGEDTSLNSIAVHDFRRWITTLRTQKRFANHPYTQPMEKSLSPASINNYLRGIKLLLGTLIREEFHCHLKRLW